MKKKMIFPKGYDINDRKSALLSHHSHESSVTTPHSVEDGQYEIIFTPKPDELIDISGISKRLYVG